MIFILSDGRGEERIPLPFTPKEGGAQVSFRLLLSREKVSSGVFLTTIETCLYFLPGSGLPPFLLSL